LAYKSFKQFVAEEWKRGSPVSSNKSYGRKWALHHSAKVGNHDVNVIIQHQDKEFDEKKLKGAVSVDFQVDGSFDKEHIQNSKHGMDILHHVHKVVKHYIERRKPNKLDFMGNSDRKNQMYAAYAKRLAKSVGGTSTTFNGLGTTVHLRGKA